MIAAKKHIVKAIVLSLILCLHAISNIVTVVHFVVNQEQIAKTLCIQKEAQNGCNGKCQLKKKLNISSAAEQEIPLQQISIETLRCAYIQPNNDVVVPKQQYLQNFIIDHSAYHVINVHYELDIPPPITS